MRMVLVTIASPSPSSESCAGNVQKEKCIVEVSHFIVRRRLWEILYTVLSSFLYLFYCFDFASSLSSSWSVRRQYSRPRNCLTLVLCWFPMRPRHMYNVEYPNVSPFSVSPGSPLTYWCLRVVALHCSLSFCAPCSSSAAFTSPHYIHLVSGFTETAAKVHLKLSCISEAVSLFFVTHYCSVSVYLRHIGYAWRTLSRLSYWLLWLFALFNYPGQ